MFSRDRPLFSVQVSAGIGSDLCFPCHPQLSRDSPPGQQYIKQINTCCINRAERRKYKPKVNLILICLLILFRPLSGKNDGLKSPARIREMHFFSLCFYKTKHCYSFHSERSINQGRLPVLSF